MQKWNLKRTKQCEKCPWKVATNPHEIPDGYTLEGHENLRQTIADENINFGLGTLNIMACHASEEAHCIGWLVNQLGVGNNIALRIRLMTCENRREIKTFGDQHRTFDDTFGD
jgi:hypothetical protein